MPASSTVAPPASVAAFVGDCLMSRKRPERGRGIQSLRWSGNEHELWAVCTTSRPRAILGLLVMLAVTIGSLLLGVNVQNRLGGLGGWGDTALFVIVIGGIMAGGCAMALILPRQDVSVHLDDQRGP